MKTQSLNGEWKYRIGKGAQAPVQVPFSVLPVGHSECEKTFDLDCISPKTFLQFNGITYYAKVYLNDVFIGEMLPYCEYKFDITDAAKQTGNILLVELEDIAPAFGPSNGWENYSGIIRDVSLIYSEENYIEDVFFHSTLKDEYRNAEFVVETKSSTNTGEFDIKLFFGDEIKAEYQQSAGQPFKNAEIKDVALWSPDAPNLYRLEVSLSVGGKVIDTKTCDVGFREFSCDRHRFLLNGKPLFLKGVCKHEMFGDSCHCPTEAEMLKDMQMIKETGCNFVRLVHYPHNKKILSIADRLGLMVSEEPGLWWSDTSNQEIHDGSIAVLRKTILRDRNHPSIMFWLCFNECYFTEKFLVDSAKACREMDPTRMVSGANCMSDEDTLKFYNICGFDFYTMHPYSDTFARARTSAQILNDKPLLFTEWGGYYVYDNVHLLKDFMDEMYELYLANSDEGALAGAFFWEWSEVNEFTRAEPACYDGVLREGLVDKYRKPNMIYSAFCESPKKLYEKPKPLFWIDYEDSDAKQKQFIALPEQSGDKLNEATQYVLDHETMITRKREIRKGPRLENVEGLLNVPMVINDNDRIEIDCSVTGENLSIIGMVGVRKGYPLWGGYGEEVAEMTVCYHDGTSDSITFKNGVDVTTIFRLNGSSKINPIAENSKRFAIFGYEKNFEHYILNKREVLVNKDKRIEKIVFSGKNNGYDLLVYGITV